MTAVLSNSDSILVAIPMVGILIACFFRLDEMIGTPKKRLLVEHRRQISGSDQHGVPMCTDPDGRHPMPARNKMAPRIEKIRIRK